MTGPHAEPGAGKVVTFYSYKGGTGRSMALANVACLLARRTGDDGRGVLAIDWDLEAPGLHRYLGPGTEHQHGRPGLIELFTALAEAAATGTPAAAEAAAAEVLARVDLEEFVTPTGFPGLSFMPAGRFDDSYPARVTGFDWNALHQRIPGLVPSFAHLLAERYAWVLVDSRTGISDTSGICTMLMPELLVVVFTPNLQSLTGLVELVRKAADYRRRSNDVRPLVVFPLPSRIEQARPALLARWRLGRAEDGLEGYQRQFEKLFAEVYALPDCDLGEYFDEVQVQRAPDFAYGEQIAVQIEESGTRLSLGRSYETFTKRLADLPGPWVDPNVAAVEREVEELRTRGQAALEDGDPRKAQALLLRAADRHRETAAARSPDLAGTLLGLGSHLLDAGELTDAETVLGRAVETARRVFGSDDLEVVPYVHRLADAAAEAGREDEAIDPVRQTVRVLIDTLGGDNVKVADAHERLGNLLLGAYRRSIEAKERVQRSLQVRRRTPPLHPDRRLSEAEEAFRRSLEIRERLPDAGDALVDSLERLAEIAIESGRLELGRHYLDRVLSLSGTERPEQRARVLNQLGQLHSRMGRLDEAERVFKEALQLGQAGGAVARATVADSQDGLAEIAWAQHDHDRARALYEEAHLAREELFGPAHPGTLRNVLHLGDLAMDEGEWSGRPSSTGASCRCSPAVRCPSIPWPSKPRSSSASSPCGGATRGRHRTGCTGRWRSARRSTTASGWRTPPICSAGSPRPEATTRGHWPGCTGPWRSARRSTTASGRPPSAMSSAGSLRRKVTMSGRWNGTAGPSRSVRPSATVPRWRSPCASSARPRRPRATATGR